MYKLKYYGLTDDERKKLKEEFYKTKVGMEVNNRLIRVLITGIFGLLFSIYLFINYNIYNLIVGIILCIFSVIFIIGSFKVRIKKLNEYLVSKKG